MKAYVITLIILLLALTSFVQTQDDEAANSLLPNASIEGSITSAGEEAIWMLYALREDVFSFHVQAVDEGFDPIITLRFNGIAVIRNDDVLYPDHNDALLEAITIPRTGVYEVAVSGFNDTTGNFILTMQPGYATVAVDERFVALGSWGTENLGDVTLEDGALVAVQRGVRERGWLDDGENRVFGDFYAMLTVQEVTGNNGWAVGLAFRKQANGDSYVAMVNGAGWWRLIAVENGEDRILRDWAPHPAIIPNEPAFMLSVLANSDTFEIFYDGQLLGRGVDSGLGDTGQMGILVETPDILESEVQVAIDDLLVTVPSEIDGAAVQPKRIIASDETIITHELERRHVIPGGGQLTWKVSESFAQKDSPGVGRVFLAQGIPYRDFVMGTTFTLETALIENNTVGCGLLLRSTGDNDYMAAYLDNTGAAGVSQRSGDTFLPGIFIEDEGLFQRENTLVVVVNDTLLHYYVNGQKIGSLVILPVEGEVGNVVLPFDPVSAACSFTNTWLWSWGS